MAAFEELAAGVTLGQPFLCAEGRLSYAAPTSAFKLKPRHCPLSSGAFSLGRRYATSRKKPHPDRSAAQVPVLMHFQPNDTTMLTRRFWQVAVTETREAAMAAFAKSLRRG